MYLTIKYPNLGYSKSHVQSPEKVKSCSLANIILVCVRRPIQVSDSMRRQAAYFLSKRERARESKYHADVLFFIIIF